MSSQATVVAHTGKVRRFSPIAEREQFSTLPLADRLASIENLIHRCLRRVDARNRDDVYQEIVLDLIANDGKYDPARGKYSTWSVWRIRHVITDQARKHARQKVSSLRRTIDFSAADAIGSQMYGASEWRGFDAVDESDETAALRAFLDSAMRSLTQQQQSVLKRRFGIGCQPMLLREISDEDGVTRQRVEQVEKRAIGILRDQARRLGVK